MRGVEQDLAVHLRDTLAHTAHAVGSLRDDMLLGHAAAVIADGQDDLIISLMVFGAHPGCAGMSRHIAQRLLEDAEQVDRGRLVQFALGALLLALFFAGTALGSGAFGAVSWILDSVLGRVIIFLFSWALFHHLLGGVRHALWDRGVFFDPKGRELAAQATLYGGAGLTILFWIVVAIFG